MTIADQGKLEIPPEVPPDLRAEAKKIAAMRADKAIAYLEDKKPGFLETYMYGELKHAIKKYPATLAMKKLAMAMMDEIDSIENKEDRNQARRVFVRAALDVSERGRSGAIFFLDQRNIDRLLPVAARSDDDPKIAQKAAETTTKNRDSRSVLAVSGMVTGGLAMLVSARALANNNNMLNSKAFRSQPAWVTVEGEPQHKDSTHSKVAVFLAGMLIAAAGAYGTFGPQPTDISEDLIEHLNPSLDKMLNRRLNQMSGEGGLGSR